MKPERYKGFDIYFDKISAIYFSPYERGRYAVGASAFDSRGHPFAYGEGNTKKEALISVKRRIDRML